MSTWSRIARISMAAAAAAAATTRRMALLQSTVAVFLAASAALHFTFGTAGDKMMGFVSLRPFSIYKLFRKICYEDKVDLSCHVALHLDSRTVRYRF